MIFLWLVPNHFMTRHQPGVGYCKACLDLTVIFARPLQTLHDLILTLFTCIY